MKKLSIAPVFSSCSHLTIEEFSMLRAMYKHLGVEVDAEQALYLPIVYWQLRLLQHAGMEV